MAVGPALPRSGRHFGPADIAALAAGLALPFAFAPWNYWPLALISPAVLFLAWRGATPRRAARLGWGYGFAAFLTGTWWTFVSVREFGGAPLALAAFLTFGLAAIMGVYYALLGWLGARWLPAGGAARWLVALPAGWLAVEWLRGWFLSGFPWLSLGYSQTDSVLGSLIPLGGVYGVSWVCALAAGGATGLNLYICYRPLSGTIATIGLGVFDLRTQQNTRNLYGLSAVTPALAAGTYELGLCGSSSNGANWNSNEWGYVSATVFNQ